MRPLKTLTTILALVLLAASLAFAELYPPETPKDFKNTPLTICQRNAPSAVYFNTYGSEKNQWIVMLIGKNSKDLILAVERWEENLDKEKLLFVTTDTGWQRTTEEAKMEIIDSSFSAEEKEYFLLCTLQSIQKILDETPNELGIRGE